MLVHEHFNDGKIIDLKFAPLHSLNFERHSDVKCDLEFIKH